MDNEAAASRTTWIEFNERFQGQAIFDGNNKCGFHSLFLLPHNNNHVFVFVDVTMTFHGIFAKYKHSKFGC
jgi:hypothetical protein